MHDAIQTIRYMGNKSKLLDFIIPYIESVSNPGDIICDIMAGTNSIGYALKSRNIIISNDIQYYSYVIANALLNNYKIPSFNEMKNDLDAYITDNIENKHFNYFEKNYSDTYFSTNQCIEIDSIRYAISKINDENRRFLYLTLLMNSMCKAQSTTGHFAQYLQKESLRLNKLRQMSIIDNFYMKLYDFDNFLISKYNNFCYNLDYNDLFNLDIVKRVKCFYLDSPYTNDQYSRFYHILETVCKYDNPHLNFKAKYRIDRAKSLFCYKKTVADEFKKIVKFAFDNHSNLVISYSNKGVISVAELYDICKTIYEDVTYKELDFNHSSQGSGNIHVKEVIYILKR